MKCLVVIGTIAGMGGAERQALYLVEHLASLPGVDVEVLAFEDGEALTPALSAMGVKVHVVEYYHLWPRARRARALMRIAQLLRFKVGPDAILPFVGIHSKTMALAWPYSGARYCWWNQQDEGRDLNGTDSERGILRKASDILSNSYAGRDFLAQTYGLDPATISVYNNGTPLPESTRPSGLWRGSLGAGDRMLVTMVANISPYKDHSTLLDAWVEVGRSFSDSDKPLLVFAGNMKEAALTTALKTRAFDLGLSSSDVQFIGTVANVGQLLADSDVVVHSTIAEGCPNSVCEAMAMARPVVATDISGCRQALGESGREWLTAPCDAPAMAARIVMFLRDPELRREVGARNRARIESDFSITAMNGFFMSKIKTGLLRSPT